jgi:hypothetical protein
LEGLSLSQVFFSGRLATCEKPNSWATKKKKFLGPQSPFGRGDIAPRLNGARSTTIVQAGGFIRARRRIAIRVIMGSKG